MERKCARFQGSGFSHSKENCENEHIEIANFLSALYRKPMQLGSFDALHTNLTTEFFTRFSPNVHLRWNF